MACLLQAAQGAASLHFDGLLLRGVRIMIGRHHLLDGVGLDVTTRANEKVRLQLWHAMFEPAMGNMTPETARKIAADLVIAADIIEANRSITNAGSSAQ